MSNWVMYLVVGILAIVLGGFAIVYPQGTAVGLELFIAWSFIILGIVTIIMAIAGRENGGIFWVILLAVLMIIAGIVMVKNPLAGVAALGVILGILSAVQGFVMLFGAFGQDLGGNRWWLVISGVASLVLSWLIFTAPAASIGILFGVQLIFNGVAFVGFSFSVRQAGRLF